MIRLATAHDYDFIYNLYMDARINPFLLYEWMDANTFRPIFDGLIEQEVKYIFGNQTEDAGMFKLIPLQHRNDHIAYLGGLAIHPLFSGRGAGRTMLQEIIDLANKKNFLRIELSVAVTNKRAIELYERSGFQQEGILRNFTHLKSKHTFVDEAFMSFIF